MPIDSELADLDPCDILDREAARLDRWFANLPASEWSRPTRCEGWSKRDLLAHLASGESYHRACLDGEVKALFSDYQARGARSLAEINTMSIADLEDRHPHEVVDQWRVTNADNRRRFRDRGDGTVDTAAGAYPSRWQAFHVAAELAVHANDIGVPITEDERDERRTWMVRVARFALREAKPELCITVDGGRTRVDSETATVVLNDDELIAAVTDRPADGLSLDTAARAMLSIMP